CSVGGGEAWVPPSCMTSGSAAEAEHAGGGASRQARANSVAQECRVVLRVRGAYCGARTPELVITFRAARGTARIVRSDDRVEVLNVLPHQAVHVAYAVVVACTAACVGHVSLASHRVHLEQLANRCRVTLGIAKRLAGGAHILPFLGCRQALALCFAVGPCGEPGYLCNRLAQCCIVTCAVRRLPAAQVARVREDPRDAVALPLGIVEHELLVLAARYRALVQPKGTHLYRRFANHSI